MKKYVQNEDLPRRLILITFWLFIGKELRNSLLAKELNVSTRTIQRDIVKISKLIKVKSKMKKFEEKNEKVFYIDLKKIVVVGLVSKDGDEVREDNEKNTR